VPARRIPPGVQSAGPMAMCPHCGMKKPVDLDSLGHGYDYDYINEDVILNRMEVRDGRLVLPDGMSYRMMVLPDRESISPEALRRIGEFIAAGATVAGRKPVRSNSLRGYPDCDREVRELADRIWGPCDGESVRSHPMVPGRVFWNVPLEGDPRRPGRAARFHRREAPNNDEWEIDFIHRATGRRGHLLRLPTPPEHAFGGLPVPRRPGPGAEPSGIPMMAACGRARSIRPAGALSASRRPAAGPRCSSCSGRNHAATIWSR
jgi:hypothetical protein